MVAAYALTAGYRVRGTVRSIQNKKKLEAIQRLRGPNGETIEFMEAELDKEKGWKEAVENVQFILHVASPVPVDNPKDPEAEVIQPAIQGVLNVLKAAATPSSKVQRIVLTSSIAAVNEGRIDEWSNRKFNENDWSNISNPSATSPYAISKTKAEQAAWNFMNNDYPQLQKSLGLSTIFDLVVINPGLIIGPPATDAAASSTIVYSRLFTRSMPAIPNLNFAAIDVRDVAKAHLRALIVPEAKNKRFILINDNLALQTMAIDLAKEFDKQGYTIPEHSLPSFIVRLASYFDSALGIVAPMLDKIPQLDNNLAKKILGFNKFYDLQESNIVTAYSLLARQILPDKSTNKELSTIPEKFSQELNTIQQRNYALYYYTVGNSKKDDKNNFHPIKAEELEWIRYRK